VELPKSPINWALSLFPTDQLGIAISHSYNWTYE